MRQHNYVWLREIAMLNPSHHFGIPLRNGWRFGLVLFHHSDVFFFGVYHP